jgi:hypothetical protein
MSIKVGQLVIIKAKPPNTRHWGSDPSLGRTAGLIGEVTQYDGGPSVGVLPIRRRDIRPESRSRMDFIYDIQQIDTNYSPPIQVSLSRVVIKNGISEVTHEV